MIAIIKYNAGNISSVKNALKRLGYNSIVTDDREEILNADKVIFPGVGEASTAMKYLKDKKLDQTILEIKKPAKAGFFLRRFENRHVQSGKVAS